MNAVPLPALGEAWYVPGMRVWELRGAGLDQLVMGERPEPSPDRGEVVVRVKAASLNFRDWMIANGIYRLKTRFPLVPLSDGAGEVLAVGRDVTSWRVGDRVVTSFFTDWVDGAQTPARADTALGGAVDGVLAEQIVLPAHALVRTPEHLSDIEAATLPCAGVTAWHALFEGQDPLRPGQTVLLEGTGGVSVFGLQLAKLAGARVIMTSSSDAKLARARALGADETVNYVAHPDWQEHVRALTAGRGVDHVLEVGGKETLGRALQSLCHGGQLHLIGGVTGFASELPLGLMAAVSARFRRLYVGSVAMFDAMNRAVSHHRLKPQVDRTFAFDQARRALESLKAGTHFGKIVIAY
jgi:NADPH:quinone reductase-like Zn-dependent oxidoreductase